jgi:hypothetical protein
MTPKSHINLIVAAGISMVSLLLVSACDLREPKWRTYEEINARQSTTDRNMPSVPEKAPVQQDKNTSLHWTTPEGWNEEGGSGMRLATFTVASEKQSAACSLVVLGGAAGGLEANTRRWLGQLNIEAPPPEKLAEFLDRQLRIESTGGFDGVVVDLTEMGPAEDGTSMLAALYSINGTTLFIKFTGPLDLLKSEKNHFIALCKSIRSSP